MPSLDDVKGSFPNLIKRGLSKHEAAEYDALNEIIDNLGGDEDVPCLEALLEPLYKRLHALTQKGFNAVRK